MSLASSLNCLACCSKWSALSSSSMALLSSVAELSDLALLLLQILLATRGLGASSFYTVISPSFTSVGKVLFILSSFLGILYPARSFKIRMGAVGVVCLSPCPLSSFKRCWVGTHLPNLGGSVHPSCLQSSVYFSLSTS